MIDRLFGSDIHEFHVNGELYRVKTSEFDRLYAETIELGIAPPDLEAFLKRWIEPDEGEWVEVNGKRYPRE